MLRVHDDNPKLGATVCLELVGLCGKLSACPGGSVTLLTFGWGRSFLQVEATGPACTLHVASGCDVVDETYLVPGMFFAYIVSHVSFRHFVIVFLSVVFIFVFGIK